jgi:hypothetical protein
VALALLNPNLEPVTVLLEGVGEDGLGTSVLESQQTLTIPPSILYFANLDSLLATAGGQLPNQLWATASAPMRMIEYQEVSANPAQFFPPTPSSGSLPPLTFTLPLSPSSVCWQWQTGTPAPQPASVNLSGNFGFTLSVSGSRWFAPWLSVSPTQGTGPATLTLTPNVAGLTPGNLHRHAHCHTNDAGLDSRCYRPKLASYGFAHGEFTAIYLFSAADGALLLIHI